MNTPTTPATPDLPQAPGTRAHDTLADEVFVDDGRPAALPTATATASATVPPHTPAPAPVPEPQWLTGPAPFALVLGLLGLLVAGSTLVNELTDVTLPWNDMGPWSVVIAGVVVLLVGAIGLRTSRSRG